MARLALLVVLLAMAAAAPASSQVGQVPVNGKVLLPGVTGAGVRMLDFGILDAIEATRLLATDTANPSVGHLSFTGLNGPEDITVDIALPEALRHVDLPDATIPVTFDDMSAYACLQRKSSNPAYCFDPWNPATSGTMTFSPPSPYGLNSGTLNLYVGGQLPPASEYAAGTYEAAITVTVSRV